MEPISDASQRKTLPPVALLALFCIPLVAGNLVAQRWGRRGFRPRAIPDRSEFPMWENEQPFEKDVFTFARIRYTPHYHRGWDADYPEADWNISYRLQQLTTMKVNPNPVVLELTDPSLSEYPFIFISAPMSVIFTVPPARRCVFLRHYGSRCR